jgi:hypothetical protein
MLKLFPAIIVSLLPELDHRSFLPHKYHRSSMTDPQLVARWGASKNQKAKQDICTYAGLQNRGAASTSVQNKNSPRFRAV